VEDRDPNEGSIDPMVEEYWLLGEALQDRILAAGYAQESVDGIAVDVHDLLQAADLVRTELAQAVISAKTREQFDQAVSRLQQEFHHLAWHGRSGDAYLSSVVEYLGQGSGAEA
jgi:hypothetical protein